MVDKKITPQLPKLPDNMFWRIGPMYGYRFYPDAVMLMSKRPRKFRKSKTEDVVVDWLPLENNTAHDINVIVALAEHMLKTLLNRGTAIGLRGDYPPKTL